jgi:hypothetical protein
MREKKSHPQKIRELLILRQRPLKRNFLQNSLQILIVTDTLNRLDNLLELLHPDVV